MHEIINVDVGLKVLHIHKSLVEVSTKIKAKMKKE
jgi:hypothetical protein